VSSVPKSAEGSIEEKALKEWRFFYSSSQSWRSRLV